MQGKATFARKACTMAEVNTYGAPRPGFGEPYQIRETIHLNETQWDAFRHAPLADQPWLDAYNIRANTSAPSWYSGKERPCLLAITPDGTQGFLIDTQGYEYARYIAVAPAEAMAPQAPSADDVLAAIARDHLKISTLETRNSDELDFHDVSVWALKDALAAAYAAGAASKSI